MPQVSRKRSRTRPGTSVSVEQNNKPSSTPKKRKISKEKDEFEKDAERTENDSGFSGCSTSLNLSNISVVSGKPDSPSYKSKIKCKKGKNKSSPIKNIENMDVAQLLALGENSHVINTDLGKSFEESSDSGMSDLEEVKESNSEPVIPKEGVNITLEVPNLYQKHKRRKIDLESHLKRQMNRVKKDIQLLIHKVHLLCWIAHIKFVNNVLNNPNLMEICITLVKSKNLYPPKYADLTYLEGILKWFHKNFELKKDVEDPKCTGGLLNELSYQFDNKQAFSHRDFIFMFIALLRVLGLKARIVMSFQIVPVKPSSSELFSNKSFVKTSNESASQKAADKPTSIVDNNKNVKLNIDEKIIKKLPVENPEEINTNNDQDKPILKKKSISNMSNTKGKGKMKAKISNDNDNDDDDDNDKDNDKDNDINNDNEANKKKKDKNQEGSVFSEEDDDIESKHFKIQRKKSSKVNLKSNSSNESVSEQKIKQTKESKTKRSKDKTNKRTKTFAENLGSDSDSDNGGDFTPQSLKKSLNKKVGRKSAIEKEPGTKKKEGFDVWTEIYLEAEEKWMSVDVVRQKIHCLGELYSRATHPVVYVIACNNDSTLKDITKKYVPNWHSDTRKKRVDEEWWNNTMLPYLPPSNTQDKGEDEDINRQLLDKPLPSVISEYKDHPLYALKRHLLKFEGIYPPDAPTLGFIRGEPVYARECVVTLRSREMWFKEARVVRLKEEPYKIVKARPKFDKMSGVIKKDLPLELFGKWQTEDYIPPIAVDGKVPRNEYGNVDLFKPCMLPIGTVHLEIPALNRVAKKLGIDCAPATVGFEFHSGGSHPIFNGFVVCEEFKEVLLDAWNKEIDESVKRGEEKRLKRVYGNWKRLIRGLLIREKLKLKYAFGENLDNENDNDVTKETNSSSP